MKIGSSHTASAMDEKEVLGDKSLGDYLNQLSDPNQVNEQKQLRATGKNELGKDDFLKLMLTQMKHQDPTNPLKSHEMAAQLAQFTSLEQLVNINEGIQTMGGQKTSSVSNYDVLGFMGKEVSGDSSQIFHDGSDENHALSFNLGDDAQDVLIKVKDAAGNVIREYELKNLKKGENSVDWDGKTEEGLIARKGEYKIDIEAKASNGKKLLADTQFEGKVSGVQFSPTGPILLVGEQQVRLSDVKKIIDPAVTQDRKTTKIKRPDLSRGAKESQNENMMALNEKPEKQAPKGNIDKLPMSRGLLNKLSKLR